MVLVFTSVDDCMKQSPSQRYADFVSKTWPSGPEARICCQKVFQAMQWQTTMKPRMGSLGKLLKSDSQAQPEVEKTVNEPKQALKDLDMDKARNIRNAALLKGDEHQYSARNEVGILSWFVL